MARLLDRRRSTIERHRLRRRNVEFAMVGIMITFAGVVASFTYLRPFLETCTHVAVPELSLLLLALGVAGFAGTYGAGALVKRRLYLLLGGFPVALAAVTVGLLLARYRIWGVAIAMFAWRALNSGGLILDRFSIAATFIFGTLMLVLAGAIIGDGKRLMPADGHRGSVDLRESDMSRASYLAS